MPNKPPFRPGAQGEGTQSTPLRKEPIGKSVWGNRGRLSRSEIRGRLRDQKLFKHGLGRKERIELEEKVFDPKKYGSDITEKELEQAIKDLQREQRRTPENKFEIEKQIRTLKGALGQK